MAAPTQNEVDSVVAAYENAKGAAEYASTIVLEMRQNGSSSDYTMVWTEHYPSNGG